VYSSAPETTQLACAFQNARRAGLGVVVLPIAQLPATGSSRKELLRLREQLLDVTQLLANVGLKLDLIETGQLVPDAGEEPGLRAERDSLFARQRGLLASIKQLEGGVVGG
jgi:hypothetical protein